MGMNGPDLRVRELPREDAPPATTRGGLRFADAGVEDDYRRWLHARGVPVVRARAIVSSVVWATILSSIALWGPPGLARWLPGFALVFCSLFAIDYAARHGTRRVATTVVLSGNAATGLVAVTASQFHLGEPTLAFGSTIMACFFQLTSTRVPSELSVVSVLPYMALELWLIVAGYRDGSISERTAIFAPLLLGMALFLATMVALVADRAQRVAFQQERVIEAQKDTIARERARREALLEDELRHQVAERSRELGVALAKADVTLDVRRLSPGERFDARYRIVRALGAGGMGAVYEVERLTDGQRLALKAVVGEVSGANAARFAREAEIGARLRHANLVPIVDVGVSSGVPFLVMDLVRGGSLESRRDRFGDVRWALAILKQIADGLVALHDAGVVHRDLKPANVLLSDETDAAVATISDFGISRFGALDDQAGIDPTGATVGPSSPSPHALTGTGIVMGTPLYMAPEGARGGRAVDAPADVFAFGTLAFELLVGRVPFTIPPMMLAMSGQPLPDPPAIDDRRVPPELVSLLRGCLVEDPTRRPRMRELVLALATPDTRS